MGEAVLYRWPSHWQEIPLLSACRICCAHTNSVFSVHTVYLIWPRLIRFMAGGSAADLHRYWAFEAARNFTMCLHTWHKISFLSIPECWQHDIQGCIHTTECSTVMWRLSVIKLHQTVLLDTNTQYLITLYVNKANLIFYKCSSLCFSVPFQFASYILMIIKNPPAFCT